ncbi:MAG: rubrerythrin family protein [DPANN group archaeon]|nr:rubrerythrin family protein [DPANN group archaeon]
MLSRKVMEEIEQAQINELTEHIIYTKLAQKEKNRKNRKILQSIAADEARHAAFWQKLTKKKASPNRWKIFLYFMISRIFGLVFGLKLMERGEDLAQTTYARIGRSYPAAISIKKDEQEHEKKIIGMIEEQHLEYVGSIVLGLNDALVELTGALAGFTLALQDSQLIALVGLITGIAASLSMAASEYLSMKEEQTTKQGETKSPLIASFYTGVAYIFTVTFLILPFLLLSSAVIALVCSLVIAVMIIFLFTFYTSVTNDLPFRRRFLRMAAISLGVALLSFGIGFLVKMLFGIDA